MNTNATLQVAEDAAVPGVAMLRKIPDWIWSALVAFILGWVSCHYYEAGHKVAVSGHPMEQLGDDAVNAARAPGTLKPQQPLPPGALTDAEFEAAIAGADAVVRPGVMVTKSAPQIGPINSGPYNASIRWENSAQGDQPAPAATSGPLVATAAEIARCKQLLMCPATVVDGTLITEKDGTPDLLLSAKGRTITSAVFSPPSTVTVPVVHPWALGLTYSSSARIGGFVDRDLGPLRLGVEAERGHAAIRLGWRF